MFKISLKGVLAHKRRARCSRRSPSCIATAFLAGTFIFSDTIQRTFDELFADVFRNTDAFVRASRTYRGRLRCRARAAGFPTDLIETVRAVPGVAEAEGDSLRLRQ